MAITVGTNSWITQAEADSYMAQKYGADAWAGLSGAVKEQLIVSAFRFIKYSGEVSVADSASSDAVKSAQSETAWYLYKFGEEHEKRSALSSQGVKSFRLDDWSETLSKTGLPEIVRKILDDFLVGEGGYFPVLEREND